MAKVVILLILAGGYVAGVHALADRALTAEQTLANFYTSPTDPLTAIPASLQLDATNH